MSQAMSQDKFSDDNGYFPVAETTRPASLRTPRPHGDPLPNQHYDSLSQRYDHHPARRPV